MVHGDWSRPAFLDDEPLRSTEPLPEFARLVRRSVAYWRGRDGDSEEITSDYIRAFQRARCQAVLVEFGQVAVQAMSACRRLRLPMIVHFHGFDVHSRSILDRVEARYAQLFEQAAALIVVSSSMEKELLRLGAPRAKTHYLPNAVDPSHFRVAAPGLSSPTFVAVGRFVQKKGPQLTIAAFALVHRRFPEARLRMIGDGVLRGPCSDLARGLGMGDAVTFLGTQPNTVVAKEMSEARAFVQHSVVASDGDSEGMPVSVLEASASGLPVVSTRHAGIPEVVVDGETGLLVDERDVEGMSRQMERLIQDPSMAARLGHAGRQRIEMHFTVSASIDRLWQIIQSSARH